MENKSLPRNLENALYLVVFLTGVACIGWSYLIRDVAAYKFSYDLLLNLGSDMTVVTIVFGIYKFFNSRSKVPEHLRGRLSSMASPDPGTIRRKYGAEDVQKD